MAESITQIRSDIETTKEHISQTLGEIEHRFQEMKDWRAVVHNYPLASIAVSFGVGLLLSGLATPILRNVRGNARHMATSTISSLLMQQLRNRVVGNLGQRF
jgi:hypothetical protein